MGLAAWRRRGRVEDGQRKLGREEGLGMGWVRTGIGQSLRCGINNCVPAPARLRRRRRGARAGAVISVDRQAYLACHCLYVYEGGAGRDEGPCAPAPPPAQCRAAGSSDWRWGRMTCPSARTDSDLV